MAQEQGYWQRKLTRRSTLKGATLAGAGLAAVSLIGCSGQQTPGTTTGDTTREPKRGGLLTHAGGNGGGTFDTQGVGFDPHTYVSIATSVTSSLA
jgi:hypothetical protein